MRGTLYIQYDDKGRRVERPDPIECEIDLGRRGQAIAGVGRDMVAKLTRARVEAIAANGILISGVVSGYHGDVPTMQFQEWWFVPIITGREEQAIDSDKR